MSHHMGAESQTQILDKHATYIELFHIMAYRPLNMDATFLVTVTLVIYMTL